jgi:hypothetical protein
MAGMPLNNYPTYEVSTVDDERRLLKEHEAVLCVWVEWSLTAMLTRAAIRYWHERWHLYCKAAVVPLYLMDGDKLPELFEWMRSELQEMGGYGSLHLFKNGKVVAAIPSVIDAGLLRISKACDEHFSQ